MKISEIFDIEKENLSSCFLIKDGIFWRAFEKSAYWFVTNLKPYSITKKHFKGQNSDVVYLGFPNGILTELLSMAEDKGFKVDKLEKLITINGIEMSECFDQWKEALPYQMPDDNKKNMVNEPEEKYDSGLVARIRKFPVAERTPIECQQFIIELQNSINGTI
jgi:hypothetical protein